MSVLSIVTNLDSDSDSSLHQAESHRQGEQFFASRSRPEPGEDGGGGECEGNVLEAAGHEDWGDGGAG